MLNRLECNVVDAASLVHGTRPFAGYSTFTADQVQALFATTGNRVSIGEGPAPEGEQHLIVVVDRGGLCEGEVRAVVRAAACTRGSSDDCAWARTHTYRPISPPAPGPGSSRHPPGVIRIDAPGRKPSPDTPRNSPRPNIGRRPAARSVAGRSASAAVDPVRSERVRRRRSTRCEYPRLSVSWPAAGWLSTTLMPT